jgi:hypothetical protein
MKLKMELAQEENSDLLEMLKMLEDSSLLWQEKLEGFEVLRQKKEYSGEMLERVNTVIAYFKRMLNDNNQLAESLRSGNIENIQEAVKEYSQNNTAIGEVLKKMK